MMSSNRKGDVEKLLNTFGDRKKDDFDFDRIRAYFDKKDNSSCSQIVSEKVCNDLDIDELFRHIDRTNSRAGQQILYNSLRTIPQKQCFVAKNEGLIRTFLTNTGFRKKIQRLLLKLNNPDTFFIPTLFQEEHIDPPKWFFVVYLLSFTMIVSLFLIPFNPSLFFVILSVFITNLLIHYWNKKNLSRYLYSIPRLLDLHAVAKKLYATPEVRTVNPEIKEAIAIIDKIRNRTSFFKFEASLQGEAMLLFWGMLELLKIAFLLEPILLFSALKQLDTKRKEVERVYMYVGSVDMLLSVASLRLGSDKYCIPAISGTGSKIHAVNVCHPLITDCIENSISINAKSVLLTGSNMSGKTSFIRTIGINALCALTLNTCFADIFEIPKLRLFSAIRINDDLLNDKSYYFEEVLTIKEMIDRSKENSVNLFLLDEIFKGTNTVERISAGKAVLSALAKNNNITFVSTHDIELADLLKEEYELYHFSEIVENSTVAFDYKLKTGKLKNRNAIRILQMNAYPDSIIAEAMKIASELDEN